MNAESTGRALISVSLSGIKRAVRHPQGDDVVTACVGGRTPNSAEGLAAEFCPSPGTVTNIYFSRMTMTASVFIAWGSRGEEGCGHALNAKMNFLSLTFRYGSRKDPNRETMARPDATCARKVRKITCTEFCWHRVRK